MRDLDGNRYGVNTEPIKGSEEASGGVVGSEEQMTAETDQTDIDPGLFTLLLSLRLRGIDTDVEKVRKLVDRYQWASLRCCAAPEGSA
jgi:hypothetical protein